MGTGERAAPARKADDTKDECPPSNLATGTGACVAAPSRPPSRPTAIQERKTMCREMLATRGLVDEGERLSAREASILE